MSSKMVCWCVRAAVIMMALCGLLLCGFLLPLNGYTTLRDHPQDAHFVWSWLGLLWGVSLPCFAVLVYAWKVSTAIKADQVFTTQTAKWIKSAALMLFAAVGLLAVGNVVLALLGLSGPPAIVPSFFIIIFGSALAAFAAVLSRYVAKAAVLREDSEGTV
ncbi:MAG: DUF2975 domain-containing protein [Candidatus Limiplasma sp.]|nr:DUF2975 domain-containing protein [Candidatus Limiplasma sp.]